jgi:acetyltransferase-like isoleucine patch superfamily enzyme
VTLAAQLSSRLLARAYKTVGKSYAADEALPVGLVTHVLTRRIAWLVRGLLRFRVAVFVAPGVKVRGKGRIHVGSASTLEEGVRIDGYARYGVVLAERVRIGAHSIISCTSHLSRFGAGVSIGRDSGLGEWGYIGAAGGVTIGADVIMGQYVSFHSQEHTFVDCGVPMRLQGSTERGIVIEDDCWIGSRVTFLDGAHVRRGSVVAAGAVVRGQFPPFSVIGGVPARVLRDRRDEKR